MSNSFDARASLNVDGKEYEIFQLTKVAGAERLPFSMKILLENLLRHEDGKTVNKKDIRLIIKNFYHKFFWYLKYFFPCLEHNFKSTKYIQP